MKKSFFIGLSLLLVATIGAFASAQQTRLQTVYFTNASLCVSGQATVCEVGLQDCDALVIPDDTSIPPQTVIVHQTQAVSAPCNDPFKKL